jgi:HK97 family phage prohead protease
MQREYRTLPLTELRTAETEGKRTIEGHAAVFQRWSELLGGIFPFKEKVRAGAFSKTIESDDIRALFNHDPNHVLGRNKAGTLELAEDNQGLFVRIYPPDTGWARDLQVSIDRGDISQMSFGFTVEKDRWSDEGGIDTRELLEVKLYDVSPVTFPAYPDTDVSVRSYDNYQAEKRAKNAEKDRINVEKREQNKRKLQERIRKFNLLKMEDNK